jgi:hypothetical protein
MPLRSGGSRNAQSHCPSDHGEAPALRADAGA